MIVARKAYSKRKKIGRKKRSKYYPFGMVMAGIGSKAFSLGGVDNRKKYNGIEHNTDLNLNQYDAFYRTLDPQIGRFLQIDPKMESAEAWSPYSTMLNNPIRYSDPLGDSSILPYPARILNSSTNILKGLNFGLNQRFQLEPARGTTATGIRDTKGGRISNATGKPVGAPAIRVDGPGGGSKDPHINIDVLGPKDPHIPITSTTLNVLGKAGEVLEGANKLAVPAAIATDAIQIGSAINTDIQQGKSGDNTIVATAKVAGGWTGAWAGAKGGAALGAGIGSLFAPGPGTAIGGFFGGIAGGIGGAIYGSRLGQKAGEEIVDAKNNQ